jgi:murein DD-endopeptidase MepM/ murein hydrolase activator NlpD
MVDKHRQFLMGLVCVILAATVSFYDFIRFRSPNPVEIREPEAELCQSYSEAEPEQILPPTLDATIPKTLRLKVCGGDTLAQMIQKQGITRNQVHKIVHTMKNFYKPRELRANHIIELTIAKVNQDTPYFDVLELKIRPALDYEIIVKRTADGTYEAQKRTIKLIEELKWVEGEIYGNLSDAANHNGVPHKTVHDMIMVYSYDVDFQRQIQQGDRYYILYSVVIDPETGHEQPGKLIFAGLTLSGKNYELYSYKSPEGITEFYTLQGESVRKGLLRTPIDGARISSRYGHRHHPILGYTKYHKGVDFSAPTGTPIMAAGDGVVERVGCWGNYGNYVKIRHNCGYATAYAHLSRYANGLRRGQRICQGQILGYVGATGRTTGPHLHYEVIRNNHHINPLSIKMLPATKLSGSDLQAFKLAVMKIEDQKMHLKENFATMKTAKKSTPSTFKKADELG